ncbi:MAG: hypothetical protein HY867_15100 [Chloroflexi bacterium]|nr:hypothetical protein [Chloroflexota bacterium]
MLAYTLALISFFGFLMSLLIHILALFGLTNPISSAFSFLLLLPAMLLGLPGTLSIFPSSPSIPNNWTRRMGHNFWRPIPKKGVYLIRCTSIYGVCVFILTMLFGGGSKDLSEIFAVRLGTGVAMALFSFHWIGYWYHSPVEIRKDVISMFKPRKHLKRHHKHEQEP